MKKNGYILRGEVCSLPNRPPIQRIDSGSIQDCEPRRLLLETFTVGKAKPSTTEEFQNKVLVLKRRFGLASFLWLWGGLDSNSGGTSTSIGSEDYFMRRGPERVSLLLVNLVENISLVWKVSPGHFWGIER